MKDVIRIRWISNCCHPWFFGFKLVVYAMLIFLGGALSMPFMLVMSAFSNITFDACASYMFPLTMEERLSRIRMTVVYKTLLSTVVIAAAMLWGRFTPIAFLQKHLVPFSFWYLIPVALIVFSMSASTVVEQGEGLEAKRFATYNEEGIKKRKLASISGVSYIVSLFVYITIFIEVVAVRGSAEEIEKLNQFNAHMIVMYALALFCTVVSVLLLRRMTIVDYHGTETPSLIADATAGI